MGKWSWFLAAAVLSCGAPKRQFPVNEGGAAGDGPTGGKAALAGAGAGGASGGSGQGGSESGDGGVVSVPEGGDGTGGAPSPESCDGCRIGDECVADGAVDPKNPCHICQREIVDDAYSPNQGARCGEDATACSAEDVCNAAGVCETHHEDDGRPCSGGACEEGTCRLRPNPFDCIAPSPPEVEFTAMVFGPTGPPPAPLGGTIADGRYTPVRFDLYDSDATGIDIRTFEFSKGYVQAATQYYSLETQGAFIPAVRFAGSFVLTGTSLGFDVEPCDPQYTIDLPDFSYTVTSNGLILSVPLTGGGTLVTSYLRQ